MTTEEQREPREPRSSDTSVDPSRASTGETRRAPARQRPHQEANTQVGQVIQELGRLTRRLPAARSAQSRSAARNNGFGSRATPPSRERLASLIAALGDTSHPQHAQAVDELVGFGDAAVPALTEVLGPQHPWLTAFRAAEALGQIGDGRAAGALSQALHHPNSNVRWSAVRALTQVGDARSLFLLRRVAQDDRGKTSWGESVAGTAQSALDQMRTTSLWSQGFELIKTAATCVLMILALVLAFSVITTLRQELARLGTDQIDVSSIAAPTAVPQTATEAPAAAAIEPTSSPAEAVAPTSEAPAADTSIIAGTVRQSANVRSIPSSAQNTPIGKLNPGDEIVFLGVTSDRQWYRVRLGERHADASTINSADGTGWVNQALLSTPDGTVPLEDATQLTTEAPTPTP